MSRSLLRTLFALLIIFCYSPLILLAQTTNTSSQTEQKPEATEEKPPVDPTLAEKLASPRATMKTFLDAVDDRKNAEAALCLELPALSSSGPTYAYQLKYVIDRMLKIDLDKMEIEDGQDTYVLGHLAIDLHNEDLEDARKIVLTKGTDGLWRFSATTVGAIDELYTRWEDRPLVAGLSESKAQKTFAIWLRDLFDKQFRSTHFLLPDYQWLCLLVLIFLGFFADLTARSLLHWLTHAWFKFIKTDAENAFERKLWKPVGLLVQAIVWYGGTELIGLPDAAQMILLVGLKFFAVVSAVWTAFLLINLLSVYLAKKASVTNTKFDDLLVPLISKSLKVFAVCIGALMMAEAFNLPIMGLMGGLGIGGMALALASQDTVSNFFGSITVLIDRPFEVGDWIITKEAEGSVESVGFRSTRIRTFYNSLITLPNSQLTTATVDNMGRRRYRRIKTMLGLQYDTTPEQLDAFCEGIRELLRRHPYTRKDYYHVYFNQFSGSSLDVLLYCFLECPDWSIELREKHRLFSDILRLAKSLNISFAFPTRTLHLFNEQHGEGGLPQDNDPERIGQSEAARIAGPLLRSDERPGGVSFSGPSAIGSDEDDDGDGDE